MALVVPQVVAPTAAHAQTAEPPTVVDDVAYVSARRLDGQVRAGVLRTARDGSDAEFLPAEDVVVHVSEAAATTVPEDTAPFDPEVGPYYRFLGDPGDPVYTVPQWFDQPPSEGVVALGFAGDGEFVSSVDRSLELGLTAVNGPGGAFAYADRLDDTGYLHRGVVWASDPEVSYLENRFRPYDDTRDPDYNWSFTAAGRYCLEVLPRVIEVSTDGAIEIGEPGVVTVVVGGTDPAGVTPCAQPGDDPDPEAPFVFTPGMHADVAPEVGATGPLRLRLRKSNAAGGGNVSWHDADDSILWIPDAARRTVPLGAQWSFLGSPGASTWRSPYFNDLQPSVVWLGFSGAGARDAVLARGIGLRWEGVTGQGGQPAPGHVVGWASDVASGDRPLFSTRQGLPNGGLVPPHGHLNWDFSAPGVYCLGVDATARRTSGEQLRDRQTLTFVVGDEIDPATVAPCGRGGDPVPTGTHTLSPEQAPAGRTVELGAGSQAAGAENAFATLAPGLDSGGDLDVRVVRGAPDGPGTAYDPADVVFRVPERPASEPGARFWELGGSATLDLDTYGLPPEALRGDLTWALTEVSGPGAFAVESFRLGGTLLGSVDGEPRSFEAWPGHRDTDTTWTFTAPGVYCVGMRWSAVSASGAPVSDERVLTFVAGDAPAAPEPCAQDGGSTNPPARRTVLDEGHVDLFARHGAGVVELQLSDGGSIPSSRSSGSSPTSCCTCARALGRRCRPVASISWDRRVRTSGSYPRPRTSGCCGRAGTGCSGMGSRVTACVWMTFADREPSGCSPSTSSEIRGCCWGTAPGCRPRSTSMRTGMPTGRSPRRVCTAWT